MKVRLFFIAVLALLTISFVNKKKIKFKTPEKFVFIPSGTSVDANEEKYSCAPFFMLDHEVTNFEYRSFLEELKRDGRTEDYNKALPDSTQWNEIGYFNNTMMEHYFRHPAYDNYPVVNITTEGANLFCAHLTEYYQSLNEELMNPIRLPTKEEWIYAARGGHERSPYPWGGPYLKNEKGCFLSNFKTIGDQNITETENGLEVVQDSSRAPWFFQDGAYTTASVDSYSPNDFGLYNMSGNVAELVANYPVAMGGHWNSPGYDIRVTSEVKFETANPFVGFRPVMSYLKPEK